MNEILKNKIVTRAIIYYLSIILVIIVVKPSMFYNKNKIIKTVGNHDNKTLIPLPMFITVISIIVFFLSHYLS